MTRVRLLSDKTSSENLVDQEITTNHNNRSYQTLLHSLECKQKQHVIILKEYQKSVATIKELVDELKRKTK
jgi:hypothetical protein